MSKLKYMSWKPKSDPKTDPKSEQIEAAAPVEEAVATDAAPAEEAAPGSWSLLLESAFLQLV